MPSSSTRTCTTRSTSRWAWRRRAAFCSSDRRAPARPPWRGRSRAKSRFRSSPSTARSCTRSGWANPRRALREVFKKARRAAPCILFFDTIDAIAPKFGADQFGTDVYQRILSQLLREIDNLRDVKGVILLAATNRPERVEPALLRSGRFDYILPFAKPDAADRAAILRLCCRRVPLAPDVDIDEFARRTGRVHGRRHRKPVQEGDAAGDCGISGRRARVAPFVVRRSDFLAVLDSDRGSPRPLKDANAPGNAGSLPWQRICI